jgi:transcriptional regulator with XRE-family HTH domain
MTLGNAIKTLRTACKVKQRDLASQMEVSANYISLVEGDKREPSIAFLKKLSKQLNVPVSMFFLWQETDVQNTDAARIGKIRELLLGIESSYLRSGIPSSATRKGKG